MKKRKCRLSTGIKSILWLSFALLFTGCAARPDSESVPTEPETTFSVQSSTLELPEGFAPAVGLFTEDSFICMAGKEGSSGTEIFQTALEDIKQASGLGEGIQASNLTSVLTIEGHVLASCAGQNGMIYLLEYLPDAETGEAGYTLQVYDNEKSWECLRSQDITDTLWNSQNTGQTDIRLSISIMTVDSQGNVYLCSPFDNSVVWVVDDSGEVIAVSELEYTFIEDMALGSDGQIYAIAGKNKENEIFIIGAGGNRVETETGGAAPSLPYGGLAGKFITGAADRFLFSTSTCVYQCGLKAGQIKKLLEWSEAGIAGSDIKCVRMISEDEIWAVSGKSGSKNMRVTLLTADKNGSAVKEENGTGEGTTAVDVKEKRTVILTGADHSADLEEMIGLFNVSQNDYEVVVQEYESIERLYAEIASGKGPDLIRTEYIDVEQFVQKGLLEDLQTYLDESDMLSRNDLEENILRLNTVQGVLTCIPPAFTIDIITGRAADLGTETGWTLEEFYAYLQANEGAAIVEGATFGNSQYSCFSLSTHTRLSQYVNWETGEVSFDQGEFEKLLKAAGEYQSRYDDDNSYDVVGRIRDGKVLLYNAGVRKVEDILFQKEIFQGEVAYVGYPTQDGSPCYGLCNIYGFGIRSTSKVKEGAWAFIEFLAGAQKAEEVIQSAFPTVKSEFGRMLSESRVQHFDIDENGNSVELVKYRMGFPSGVLLEAYAATQEDTDMLQRLVEGASYLGSGRGMVDDIAEEEIYNFFNGDKTAEETVEVIQNRVELYVKEKMGE